MHFGFGPSGTRQRRIDSFCLMLTRAFYDEPTRFTDFTKARTFTNNFLTAVNQETKTRDFLYQVLLGYELLIRLKLQPALTSYAGIMTDYISALIVTADLFMQNVQLTTPTAITATTSLTTTNPPRYAFFAINHQRNAEGLIRIAEALSWPLMDETRRTLETAYFDLTSGVSGASYDMYDWLFGLVMPGRYSRHRVMCTLVDATPSIRNWQGAPYYDNAVVVKNKSYWPKRTVLGRVLGGLRNPKSVCGWIGPLPAPTGTDKNGGAIQGWVSLNARRLDVPVPIIRLAKPLEALGFTDTDQTTNEQIITEIVDANEYIISSGPVVPPGHQKCVFKGIHLELIPQARLNIGQTLGLPTEEYRASLDFEISSQSVRYALFTLPIFVTAPPCVGTHVMFRRQAQMRLRDAFLVKDLKDTYPVPDKMLVINAMGEGDEIVARAWCAERGKHAVIRRDVPGKECCFACACDLAAGDTGLNCNVLIWAR
ncbi:hypothetical protein N0V83_003358 [Neocucurbitaria cava]|uniref:Uncharacterized protein n=1 Tax=Neocucurbitaria cava TaxID=798079 RepID=A0A9W9CPC9_9PLEO|nr:hypothetical protein N0V83_003358 [Neocucurbitaria cava]